MATYYIGADVHSNNTELAIEKRGRIVARYSMSYQHGLNSLQGKKIFAMEEGPMAGWLYRNLHEKVDQFTVSEPRRNKLMSCEGDRDDRIDSGKLAALLRGNFLKAVHHSNDSDRAHLKHWVNLYHDHPPNKGLRNIVIQDFQIEQGKRLVQNLDFKVKYSLSGKVTYEDGSPAAAEVRASWMGMDGKAEYNDSARTDDQGHYTLASPFEVASAVGIIWTPLGSERSTPKYHRNVKPGRTVVDFILKKSKQPTEKGPS
jgi:hypothetical protein